MTVSNVVQALEKVLVKQLDAWTGGIDEIIFPCSLIGKTVAVVNKVIVLDTN